LRTDIANFLWIFANFFDNFHLIIYADSTDDNLCTANFASSVTWSLQLTLFVCPQASKISDLDQWRDPLAAIVLYTFDLSILSPHTNPEQNFYFGLNKVQQGSFLLF
jgi:hypothetical protein